MYGWLLYFLVVLVTSLVVGGHLGRFRESCTEMTGMMAGMTIGMLGGFTLGYGMTAASGRDLFLGNLIGVLLGAALGGWFGRTGGLMGIMDGAMGGVMGGSMGAMIAAMVFPDWALNWTGVLFGGVYVVGAGALVALIESRAPEHEAIHWLLPKLALVHREPRRVQVKGKSAASKKASTAVAASRSAVAAAASTRTATTKIATTAVTTTAATAVAAPMQDYYALFGVPREAGLERIEEAYLDLLADADVDTVKRADRALVTLSNPERRAMYDAALAESLKRQPKAAAAEGRGDCCPPKKKAVGDFADVSQAPQPARPSQKRAMETASTQRPSPTAIATAPVVPTAAVVPTAPARAAVPAPAQSRRAPVRRMPWKEPAGPSAPSATAAKIVAAAQVVPTSSVPPASVVRTSSAVPISARTAGAAQPAARVVQPTRSTPVAAAVAAPAIAPAPAAKPAAAQPAPVNKATQVSKDNQGNQVGREVAQAGRSKHGKRGKHGKQRNQGNQGNQSRQNAPASQASQPAYAERARSQGPEPNRRGDRGNNRGYGGGYERTRKSARRGTYAAPGLSPARRFAVGMAASLAAGFVLLLIVLLSTQNFGSSAQAAGYLNQSPQGAAYHVGNPIPSEAQLESQAVAATVGADGVQTADLVLDQATSSYKPAAIKVKKGAPVRLNVSVEGSSRDCRSVVRLPALGAQALTQPGQVVPMSFTPSQAGVYEFNCPMQMMNPSYLVVTN